MTNSVPLPGMEQAGKLPPCFSKPQKRDQTQRGDIVIRSEATSRY